jgi:acyl-CoA synthetase (AMP-forming)/AMP-acid ligase II
MQWLLDRFAEAGPAPAFTHDGSRFAYTDVVAGVAAWDRELGRNGVAAGDVVAVVADFSPESVCLLLALAVRRCIVVPVTRQSVIELDSALEISGCDWFVTFDDADREAQIERRGVRVHHALVEGLRERGTAGLILFSSGSTGVPKAILHDLDRVAEMFRLQRSSTVAIPFLMLDHFGGINTILAITSSLGHVVTVRNRTVPAICAAIEREHVELLPATPSFLTMLVTSSANRRFDLSSLRRITYGTEVMPPSTLDRVRAAFPGVELQQTYGLSEVGVLRSKSRPDGSLWMRLGGDGFETKVVEGILWIRSAFRMEGYLNAPSKFDDDGWFDTQDRVEVDGEWFRILGRATDLINVGGQKVEPAEVEDAILPLDNIAEVMVRGEPHPLLGQTVVAYVRLVHAEPLAELKRRIRCSISSTLAGYKLPSKVVVTDQPLTTSRQKKNRALVAV